MNSMRWLAVLLSLALPAVAAAHAQEPPAAVPPPAVQPPQPGSPVPK